MVVMGEQHGIDRAEISDTDRGPRHLARRRSPSELVDATGGIERRVGEDPPAIDFEQDRRPADVRDLHAHDVACATAQSSA